MVNEEHQGLADRRKQEYDSITEAGSELGIGIYVFVLFGQVLESDMVQGVVVAA